jgi:flavodoxin
MKIMIVYDSNTGNTEKMAKAVAEGAGSGGASVEINENLKGAVDAGKVKLKGKKAAVFGSYGWDGAWVMEQKFTGYVKALGYKVEQDACVEVGTDLQYHPDDHLSKCREWAKKFAESL